MSESNPGEEWEQECLKWRGVVLTGRKGHYCNEWDGLPVDETCDEFSCCTCFDEEVPEFEFPYEYVGGGWFREKDVPLGETAKIVHGMDALEEYGWFMALSFAWANEVT